MINKDISVTITLQSQYHVGSGFGLGRIIDSILKVDSDGMPLLPGSTVIGICAQGMYDLLRFEYFKEERERLCYFHKHAVGGVSLPCAVLGRSEEESCLLCYFFGSTAQEGLFQCQDFRCITDEDLLRPMFQSGEYSIDERRQVIKDYASHRQNMRSRTVMQKHFFVKEEGSGRLEFAGAFEFVRSVNDGRLVYLAAALKNVRAVGQRKTRGKGVCKLSFDGIDALMRRI